MQMNFRISCLALLSSVLLTGCAHTDHAIAFAPPVADAHFAMMEANGEAARFFVARSRFREDNSLNDAGRQQVAVIAERLNAVPFQVVVEKGADDAVNSARLTNVIAELTAAGAVNAAARTRIGTSYAAVAGIGN